MIAKSCPHCTWDGTWKTETIAKRILKMHIRKVHPEHYTPGVGCLPMKGRIKSTAKQEVAPTPRAEPARRKTIAVMPGCNFCPQCGLNLLRIRVAVNIE